MFNLKLEKDNQKNNKGILKRIKQWNRRVKFKRNGYRHLDQNCSKYVLMRNR
ncbi:unnamed protein product [Paramecium sonneborni]|uniref:Uncharacterized protein n=1 Tax=Paramecium sonneborni TaxID=65129 RepID=A0A8S1R856_9CILI|nr:unnamed protein product [Paramecium sonneborni]